ncbi:hypothetical protein BJ546DRAFT_105861, partial [Cryomyces antarcticus]
RFRCCIVKARVQDVPNGLCKDLTSITHSQHVLEPTVPLSFFQRIPTTTYKRQTRRELQHGLYVDQRFRRKTCRRWSCHRQAWRTPSALPLQSGQVQLLPLIINLELSPFPQARTRSGLLHEQLRMYMAMAQSPRICASRRSAHESPFVTSGIRPTLSYCDTPLSITTRHAAFTLLRSQVRSRSNLRLPLHHCCTFAVRRAILELVETLAMEINLEPKSLFIVENSELPCCFCVWMQGFMTGLEETRATS